MSQTRLDPVTGDLVREAGAFVRVTGTDEILQHARVKLRLIRGEVFLDQTIGIRWFEEDPNDGAVFSKGTKPEDIGGEIRGELLDTPGIVSVGNLTFDQTDEDRAERRLAITFDGTLSLTDLSERIPFHDKITVTTRGFGG